MVLTDLCKRLKMKKGEKLIDIIIGNSFELRTEELLVTSLTFVAMLMSIFATTFNIILGFSYFLIASTTLGIVWFGILYYAARIRKWYHITKKFVVISVIVLLDLMWINNAGSNGPIILVLVTSFTVFVFLFEGWKRIVFIIGYILNLIAQFYIETKHPNLITPYLSQSDRLIDFYSGFVINISLSGVLFVFIRKLYFREKTKAIESEQLKTAFFANLSHEIRTPMNGIIGFSEMLNNPNLNIEKQKKYTKIIIDNSQRLLSMVNDVLEMSKLESGIYAVSKNNVNIYELTQKLYQFFELKTSEKGLSFTLENSIENKDFFIYTDEQKLWQILSNIISNAIKFTHSGSIQLHCSIINNKLIFSIQDTGIGIDKKFHHIIFERFRQVELDLSKQAGGSGLGLSICKNLVDLIGGRIWLESEVSKGSRFYVELPIIN